MWRDRGAQESPREPVTLKSTCKDLPGCFPLHGPPAIIPLLPVTLSVFALVELFGSNSARSISHNVLAEKQAAGKKVHISPTILCISKFSKSGKGVRASGGSGVGREEGWARPRDGGPGSSPPSRAFLSGPRASALPHGGSL